MLCCLTVVLCCVCQLVPALLELLESEEAGEREGAVRALLLLAGPPLLLTPLQHLAAADPEDRVRSAAEHGLAEMGADGRAALQQVGHSARTFFYVFCVF